MVTPISSTSAASPEPAAPSSKPASPQPTVAQPVTTQTTSAAEYRHQRELLKSLTPEVLAQALAEQLAIPVNDWHRLSADRQVRAREQVAAALVYLLKDNPEEALPRLTQAIGWLDKTLKAPPCPTHRERAQKLRD